MICVIQMLMLSRFLPRTGCTGRRQRKHFARGNTSILPCHRAWHSMNFARIAEAVRETGNIYMLGETSYYYPAVIYCRQRFREGAFGDIVYAEAEYYHDWDHGLYAVAKWRGGKNWRETAGVPPMFYPHPFDESDSLYHGRAYDPRFMSGFHRSPRGWNLRIK